MLHLAGLNCSPGSFGLAGPGLDRGGPVWLGCPPPTTTTTRTTRGNPLGPTQNMTMLGPETGLYGVEWHSGVADKCRPAPCRPGINICTCIYHIYLSTHLSTCTHQVCAIVKHNRNLCSQYALLSLVYIYVYIYTQKVRHNGNTSFCYASRLHTLDMCTCR